MKRRLFILGSLAAVSCAVAHSEPVQFNRDIRPILSDRCYTCHGPDSANRKSPLRLDSEDGASIALSGGRRAVVPEKPSESELYLRISTGHPVRRMPPAYLGHQKLTAREIDLIKRWIEQGGRWEQHWAFVPPQRPPLPAISKRTLPRNATDYFVLARLETAGLAPSPEAPPETLIRRVTLDLTGLPPTPAEVDAFVRDSSPDAYERLVDRLLASPHYGERMAYRWLDAARYADTHGYQEDTPRDMWRWRDWVIDAFNRNMPFDRFTVEQIAGDLLPGATLEQKIATGFNRNHRGNGEGGIVDEEYHVEYVADRLETTFKVFQGLTIGCARCHDHKYDPFTQKEFYQLYAYFNNVPDRGRYFKNVNQPPFVLAPTPEQETGLVRLDERIHAARANLASLEPEIARGRREWETTAARAEPFDYSYDRRLIFYRGPAERFSGQNFIDAGDLANFDLGDKFTLAARILPEAPDGGIVVRMRMNFNARGDHGYGFFLVDGKLRVRMEAADIDNRLIVETAGAVELGRWQHAAVTYDGSRHTKGFRFYLDGREQPVHVIIDRANNPTRIAREPLRIGYGPGEEGRFRGMIGEVRVYDRALSPEQIAVIATPESIDAIARVPEAQRTAAQANKFRWAFLDQYAAAPARKAWDELENLLLERERLIDSFPTVMVMEEMDPPRETHVLLRGVYNAPGEKVTPGVPAVLPPLPAGAPNNRLGLARWLVDRSNPLTARVTVNLFWQLLFGAGLVKSVENFGAQGDWPEHPGLLDWLAVEFIESGWDVKRLLKTIVTSGTYRQSSRVTPELLERDPENRLLARGPRLRLPAEAIRDQALATAGLLSRRIGGPSVKPYQPDGLWEELSNAGKYKHDSGDALYRRSLYTFWKRTIGPPAMLTFDAAPRETCIVREIRTNTPLQALNLMNDVTYIEAARLLAERMIREGGAAPQQRISYGFLLATARQPRIEEQDLLLASFRHYRDRYQSRAPDALAFVSAGEHARDQSLDVPELAAYTAVASLILNLDETITKE